MQLKRQSGFTLVELLLAMAVFSVLLVIMSSGVLQLYRIYEAGLEIRDTQEAARTIAQDITNDTHDSLAVAVGTSSNGQSEICLYTTIQQQNNTLTGIEYYTGPHDASSTSLAVHRVGVTTPYNPSAAPGCGTTTGTDTVITSTAVTVKIFQANALAPVAPNIAPSLISLAMSVESADAQQPGDVIHDAVSGLDQCNPASSGLQYCSITNIQLSALSHSETSL
jgi:prepilin-type N-terminal cleavage/methylation domain-containing protein